MNAEVKGIIQTRGIQLKRHCDILNNCKPTTEVAQRAVRNARMNAPYRFAAGDVVVAYDASGRSVPDPRRLFTRRQGPDHAAQSVVMYRIYRGGKLVGTGKTPGF
jgi:hypothetical protein